MVNFARKKISFPRLPFLLQSNCGAHQSNLLIENNYIAIWIKLFAFLAVLSVLRLLKVTSNSEKERIYFLGLNYRLLTKPWWSNHLRSLNWLFLKFPASIEINRCQSRWSLKGLRSVMLGLNESLCNKSQWKWFPKRYAGSFSNVWCLFPFHIAHWHVS